MKRAILSDIHSNLEALQAVLKDFDQEGVAEFYCLGDLVGYGPNPVECIDLITKDPRRKICLLGNHDQAAIFNPAGFNPAAERAIYWTRRQLDQSPRSREFWDFIGELPRSHKDGDFLYVHGSARNPVSEYVFSDDILEKLKMNKLFSIIPRYCFQGHTHVPGIFTEEGRYFRSSELPDGRYVLGKSDQGDKAEKLMINVGSVGQPRDKDPRACYVLLDTETNVIEYRRIPYDSSLTCEKIRDIDELDNFLGERIKLGR
ncbi:MAG: metallophosphoesterase family protein [Planctomycetia bacterium]|nr:metallophosphoesterase family protein [Planctomycetia bacterium]